MFKNKKEHIKTESVDLVQEFQRELGLRVQSEQSSKSAWWIVRDIKAAHEWTLRDSATVPVFVITLVIAAFTAVITKTVAVINATSIAASVAFVIATISITASSTVNHQRIFFYTFLSGLAVIAGVGSAYSYPVASTIPFLACCFLWLANGVRYSKVNTPLEAAPTMTSEQVVASAFDDFMAKHRPDLLDEKSKLNTILAGIQGNITKAREIQARLEGEFRVVKDERKVAVQQVIEQIAERVRELQAEQEVIEKAKNELVSALQVFVAIKDDALSYVRLHSLSKEADEVLDHASSLTEQADRELSEIRQRIQEGLLRIHEATQQLGLAAASTPYVPLGALEAQVENVVVTSMAREQVIERIA